jgi:ribonucleotide monophosphatase NagD (HAD superfamily)
MTGRRFSRVLFDVHGVLVNRAAAASAGLPADQVIERLRRAGLTIAFATNSSTVDADAIVELLGRQRIAASASEVVSAGMAMAAWLAEHHPGARVLVVGQPGLCRILERALGAGALVTRGAAADVVAVGRHLDVTPALLDEVAAARGAVLLATSREWTLPGGSGGAEGPGRTVARVEQAMGTRAVTVGKPNPYLLERLVGWSRDALTDTLVVGDTPESDRDLGRAVGAATALLDAGASGAGADFHLSRLDEILALPGMAA